MKSFEIINVKNTITKVEIRFKCTRNPLFIKESFCRKGQLVI